MFGGGAGGRGGGPMDTLSSLMKPETLERIRNHPEVDALRSNPAYAAVLSRVFAGDFGAIMNSTDEAAKHVRSVVMRVVAEVSGGGASSRSRDDHLAGYI